MIGKTIRSGDFKKTVGYVLGKEAGTLILKQNLGVSNDPDRIAMSMQSCANQSKTKTPVYHLIVAWDPADHVGHDSMETVAKRLLKKLKLEEHQMVVAAHSDCDHPHMHIVVNRVHPRHGEKGGDGRKIHVWLGWKDREIIERGLREMEREFGWRQVEGRLSLQIGHEVPGWAGEIKKEYHARKKTQKPPIQRGRSMMEAGHRLHRQKSSGAVPKYLPQTAKQLFGVWKAAELGDAECQWKMGKMYAIGIGVPLDVQIAAGWMQLAALQGHPKARQDFARYTRSAPAVNPPVLGERGDGLVLGLRYHQRPKEWIGEWITDRIHIQELGR